MKKFLMFGATVLLVAFAAPAPTAEAKPPRARIAHVSPTYNYCTGYDWNTGIKTWAGSLRGGGSLAPDNDVYQLAVRLEQFYNIDIVRTWVGGALSWKRIGDHYLYGNWVFQKANGETLIRRMYCKDARSTGGHYTDGAVDGP